MREHKYRAWHRKEKQMYWFDITWGNFGQGDGWIGMIPITEKKVTYHPPNQTQVPSESVELMGYTGEKDEEGVDIWEGDFVDVKTVVGRHFSSSPTSFKSLYVVTFGEGKFTFGGYTFDNGFIESKRVVGNIFENPELLNASEDSQK